MYLKKVMLQNIIEKNSKKEVKKQIFCSNLFHMTKDKSFYIIVRY